MDQPGPSSAQPAAKTTKKRSSDRTMTEIATDYVEQDGTKAKCIIDVTSECKYAQATYDPGNFIRHFRAKHPEKAIEVGLLKEEGMAAKKPRIIAKRPIAIDEQLFIDSLIKLIANHNLSLASLEWEGLKQLLDPIASAIGITINRTNIKPYIGTAADKIRCIISSEMKGKLVSLKIDSASKHHRHILGINAQYVLHNKIVIRTLGMLEVKERQTADFLKSKIMEVIHSYGLKISQIFSITCDNGANMLAAVKRLKQELEQSLTAFLDDDDENDDSHPSEEFLDQLYHELQENLNLVRCAVHTLQLAILEVVNKSHESVKAITAIAKKCRNIKYKTNFEFHGASFPPVWGQTRWGGIYLMMESFIRQQKFFDELAVQFPELDLSRHWEFVMNYEQAFKPLYLASKKMQAVHVSLGDFYMQWLMVTNDVRRMQANPFAPQLTESLTNRLKNLRTSMAFKAALYIDPRFNYLNSKIFESDEKVQIQEFIKDTWKRISALNPSGPANNDSESSAGNNEFDDYITELFGGSLQSDTCTKTTPFLHQLKTLDVEPRRQHNFDVWQFWKQRESTHPELHAVSMVLLATPSNQVSVERAFSALSLVLSDLRTGLGEGTLADILIVKLNREVYDMVLPYLLKSNKADAKV